MTRTGEEPSGAADLSPPLARAAVCLLALLAESMHSRLSIIPVGIAIFYSRLGLGQGHVCFPCCAGCGAVFRCWRAWSS